MTTTAPTTDPADSRGSTGFSDVARHRLGLADLVALGLLAVMVAVGGLAFQPVFPEAAPFPLTVPAAVGSVGLSAFLSRQLRWSLSAALMASSACGVVVAGLTAGLSPASTPGALASAPRRILTTSFPVPADPELLVLVSGVTWLMGMGAAELLLRARAISGPLLVVAAGFVVAALLTGTHRSEIEPAGVAVAALGAGGLVLTHNPAAVRRNATTTSSRAARDLRRKRAAAAMPLVVLAALLPIAAGDHLPWAAGDDPRFDLRDEPLGDAHRMRNPLAQVSAQRDAPETRNLFTAVGPEGIRLWRVMTLDTFDGVRWTASGTSVRAGNRLPAPPEEDVSGTRPDGSPFREVELRVTLDDPEQLPYYPFLPAPGRPVAVDGVTVAFDHNGAAMQILEHEEGEPFTYTVDVLIVDPDDQDLDVARRDREGDDVEAATHPIDNAGLLIDVAVDQVDSRSDAMAGSADIRQLRALQEFFADRDRFTLAYDPSSGLSLTHLSSFVATAVEGGPSQGSIEQFATSFAVMARTLGYPTRVVVGYRDAPRDRDGVYQITNRHASAWTEVKLEGLGWVPFTVEPASMEDTPPPEEPPEETTTTIPEDDPDQEERQIDEVGPLDDDEEEGAGAGAWQRARTIGLTVVALALMAALAPFVVRVSRDRRRAGQPHVAGRIDGAWRRLIDDLAGHRVPVNRAMTATEVLQLLDTYFGKTPPAAAGELAALANRARFAPVACSAEAGDVAWQQAGVLRRWVRRQTTWADRLHAWFDLRGAR